MKNETCGRCAEPMKAHDTSPRCRYNGWKNYETWAVALWIGNEPGTYERSRELTADAVEAAPLMSTVLQGIWKVEDAERYRLADALKEWVNNELLPDLGATLAADMLGAAMSEVDWDEIAGNYLSDFEREAV